MTSRRVAVYRMLSLAFYHPTSEAQNLWSSLSRLAGEYGFPLVCEESTKQDARELEYEYNKLFVGPEHVLCPPYESVYRSDRSEIELGLVMGPSTNDTKKRYKEAGLEIAKDFKELPDHIAIELEFMYFLCANEAKSKDFEEASLWRERQREFIASHIKTWFSNFSEMLELNAISCFYKTAAKLLKEFLSEEIEYLVAA